jgi:hypothetical protein
VSKHSLLVNLPAGVIESMFWLLLLFELIVEVTILVVLLGDITRLVDLLIILANLLLISSSIDVFESIVLDKTFTKL